MLKIKAVCKYDGSFKGVIKDTESFIKMQNGELDWKPGVRSKLTSVEIPFSLFEYFAELNKEESERSEARKNDPMDFCGVICRYTEGIIKECKAEIEKLKLEKDDIAENLLKTIIKRINDNVVAPTPSESYTVGKCIEIIESVLEGDS